MSMTTASQEPWLRVVAVTIAAIGGVTACEEQPAADAGRVAVVAILQGTDLDGIPWANGWEPGNEQENDHDLLGCTDLAELPDGPSDATTATAESEIWQMSGEGPPVSFFGFARNQVLVYATVDEAEAAADTINAQLLAECVAVSVDPAAVDDIPVEAGASYDVGVKTMSYSLDLDDFVYFGGNDNSHVYDFVVALVGSAVIIHLFGYSVQSSEYLPDRRVEDQRGVVASVVRRVIAEY